MFLDPDRLIREDTEHARESGYDIIGKAGKVLFVVCTIGRSDTIRIVSARIATPTEKTRYEYGKGYTGMLSRLLDLAINDEDMVRRCI